MKSTETKKEIISFWDEHFTNAQAMSITKDDITLDTPLDECLQFLGDNCEKVLDIACGNGLCLIQTKLIGSQI